MNDSERGLDQAKPAAAKRYILLGGHNYYATGGFNDFCSSHETLDQAKAEAVLLELMQDHNWWHVWDSATNCVVAKSDTQAYGASDFGPVLDKLKFLGEPIGDPEAESVLTLAAIIREVDGGNKKGAADLAESILSHPKAKQLFKENLYG